MSGLNPQQEIVGAHREPLADPVDGRTEQRVLLPREGSGQHKWRARRGGEEGGYFAARGMRMAVRVEQVRLHTWAMVLAGLPGDAPGAGGADRIREGDGSLAVVGERAADGGAPRETETICEAAAQPAVRVRDGF